MIQRQVFIGSEVKATSIFLDDNNLPLTSLNDSLYPNYIVKDIEGSQIAFGVATKIQEVYETSFSIPENSLISTDLIKWSIEWEFVDINNKFYYKTEYFDVSHFNSDLSNAAHKLIVATETSFLTALLPVKDNVTFAIENTNIRCSTSVEMFINESYLHNVTIPINTLKPGVEYVGVWLYTINNKQSMFINKIYSVNLTILGKVADLRLYIDKMLKPIELHIGYTDAELLNFLFNGLKLLNSYPPKETHWSFSTIAPQIDIALIIAAAWWGLTTQFLAEADAAFSYSGQSVTLDADHTGFVSEQADKMKSYLDEQFLLQKKYMLQKGGGYHLGMSSPSVNWTNYPGITGQINPYLNKPYNR